MDSSHYRFRSVWRLAADPDTVFQVLEDVENYPRWWPQVREVLSVDGRSGRARFRSALPVELRVVAREERRDPEAGVLGIRMEGDLEGWARWTLSGAEGGGTVAVYDQEVVVRKRLMRRVAYVGRPVFRANHALMMRAGRRGLAAYLAGRGD